MSTKYLVMVISFFFFFFFFFWRIKKKKKKKLIVSEGGVHVHRGLGIWNFNLGILNSIVFDSE